MTIAAETRIGDIDLATLPTSYSREKTVSLPGAPQLQPTPNLPANNVSLKQQGVIARWAQENLAGSMTWAEGVKAMREQFKLRAIDPDFNLATKIMNQLRKEIANNDLSQDQVDLIGQLIGVLSGETTHWEPNIQRKIETKDQRHRAKCLDLLMDVMFGNNGAMNKFMTLFTGLYGRPNTYRSVMAAAGALTDGEPVTGDEEPY